ncbi:MAG: peptidase S10 [Planctomycetota bacterium]|nr:peptidase S10 [Planctomycetota bacterium]
MLKSRWTAPLLALWFSAALPCQDASAPGSAYAGPWERDHERTLGGARLQYRSVVDCVPLRAGGDEVVAELFHTAYFVVDDQGEADPSRPLIFAYNGGPGSASYWLHIGVMGPRRVVTPEVGPQGAPPYALEDNPASLLDVADIVMVDPVGTGLSRAVGDGKGEDFWGVDEDARSLAEFVRRFLSRHGRWNSPRYLLGESYGTTRSAVLARQLQRSNLDLNGIVLVSAVLDFRTIQFAQGDVIPFVVNVPSYAVTSAYHGALPGGAPADLGAFMKEVEGWAITDYATAVLAGSAVDAGQRRRVLEQMHRYTGLSVSYLDQSNLRVTASQYEQQILKERGLVVGRLDARFTGPSGDVRAERPSHDPQSTAISSAYTSAFNHYLRVELGYDGEREYVPSGRARPWSWRRGDGGFGGGAVNVAPDLARALRHNPKLEVLLVNGIYDLATPYFAAVWSLDNLNLPAALRDNIQRADFAAGHMMYVEQRLLTQWRDTLSAFVRRTSGR